MLRVILRVNDWIWWLWDVVGKGKRDLGVIFWFLFWFLVGSGVIYRDRDRYRGWYRGRRGV